MNRKLRYAMVGGGQGAFIGAVHRIAAGMDGKAELVAGAFSSSPDNSAATGKELFLDPSRVYGSWQEMLDSEAARTENRIDFVSIVTPNFLHHPVAKAALLAGFDVVCDKPMTLTVEESEDLCRTVSDTGRIFALTHNYTGYPMVKQARGMISEGKLGTVRKVVVEYPQGWLSTLLESTGQKQASWRSDPARAGVSSALGDIGTHCENLVHYITGLEMDEMMADLGTMVEGRALEDDASVLIRYKGGARGILYCSQISIGEENNLTIRVYGTKASLEWKQEHPNWLHVRYPDAPEQIFKRGNDYLGEAASRASRIPAGHPEAFIEAFANIYLAAYEAMATRQHGDHPSVQDGARGVHFIHTALKSSTNRAWVDASYTPPQ
ncbi:MAG: Gfo/Idh/MocA family oxidoreductase [Bacteroidetes Order II. Incertae sedis bacterium]|nr:Gfo/Idh/MocA family oxidoreductase [Bacteroidetes Order II. bacterium]MBT4602126.1 Gfo/Idh/MocA family oxidoreductase [Bacteroidetes Order II. bacterium]MBT5250240.1 Gfo/Idh/MocA family oxidoreductase [Bacteroidetes Order II. bacterium]MBT6200835.1 Gfo/Idh/MocA family oxidoreductase [Bacteroidetes Order II. bacterium]MBT6423595.1 Gfo/Idh/MocA family oxidoreductase [Bacteroidetes Order II. bacterium]